MASPGSYGSSYGSSYGAGSLGGQPSRTQPSLETTIDRSWQFDHGQHKFKCRKDAAMFLEDHLWVLAKSREPHDSDGVVRQDVIDRLQALLRDIFPPPSQLHLVPYGSFLSSCYSHSSDLDLALSGSVAESVVAGARHTAAAAPRPTSGALEVLGEEAWVELLRRMADALEERGVTRGSVTRILEARVPIIKFVEASSGIECDICVTTRGCDFKGSVMRLLHGLQPSLAPLIRLVKLWAKQHDINSAHCGTLNSWSLALMALFSQQSYPGGALLPPLWKLFYDEEPSGAGGKGRPLQDKTVQLDRMLVVAATRCGEEGDRLLSPIWAQSEPPGLLEQLLWFLSCFTAITGQWRDNPAHRNWRVSPWLARGYTSRFPKAYVAAVEEPFDCNDNTARSVGIRERNENTLPYIAWVFGHSVHVLRNVATSADAARALAWLFGPEALPCVGLQQLEVPAGGVPAELTPCLEQMATRRALEGSGGAHSWEVQQQQQLDEAAAREKAHLTFRALIDATRVGSPIMTLDEWRQHNQFNRSRPPHAWHRLALPSRPNHQPPPPRQQQPPPPPQYILHREQQGQRPQMAPYQLPPPQQQQQGFVLPPGLLPSASQGGQGTAEDARALVAALNARGMSNDSGSTSGVGGNSAGQALLEALLARPARDRATAAAERAESASNAAAAVFQRAGFHLSGPGVGQGGGAAPPPPPPGFVGNLFGPLGGQPAQRPQRPQQQTLQQLGFNIFGAQQLQAPHLPQPQLGVAQQARQSDPLDLQQEELQELLSLLSTSAAEAAGGGPDDAVSSASLQSPYTTPQQLQSAYQQQQQQQGAAVWGGQPLYGQLYGNTGAGVGALGLGAGLQQGGSQLQGQGTPPALVAGFDVRTQSQGRVAGQGAQQQPLQMAAPASHAAAFARMVHQRSEEQWKQQAFNGVFGGGQLGSGSTAISASANGAARSSSAPFTAGASSAPFTAGSSSAPFTAAASNEMLGGSLAWSQPPNGVVAPARPLNAPTSLFGLGGYAAGEAGGAGLGSNTPVAQPQTWGLSGGDAAAYNPMLSSPVPGGVGDPAVRQVGLPGGRGGQQGQQRLGGEMGSLFGELGGS